MLNVLKAKRTDGVVIRPVQNKGLVDLIAGIDAGSTQTRVCLADSKDADIIMSEDVTQATSKLLEGSSYIIPSTFAVVNDEREIKSNSDDLSDHYDSHVILVRSKATKPLVRNDRLVRGQKIKDSAGLVPRYLDSSTNKMDNAIFYLNVLDGLGYAIMQKYNGKIPSEVNIMLVLSVRPKELNRSCQDKMNENLIGEFIFRWKDISIKMNIIGAAYTTEPEAQITGTTAVMYMRSSLVGDNASKQLYEKLSASTSYMHIEGGGSSIGVEVVKDRNIIDACSSTFQLGGNYLVRIVTDRLREMKGRLVSEESVSNALQTCLLRNGREREDITSVVAAAKNQVGLDIMERIRHDVIDIVTDLSLIDMDFITLGGRLFWEDDAGQSIGVYFSKYLEQLSPNTDVILLRDNFIPQGNMIVGVLDNPDFFTSIREKLPDTADLDNAQVVEV